MNNFKLPAEVEQLVKARNNLQDHYQEVLRNQGSTAELSFTLDGNLVGDIGEAIAVELFGIKLVDEKSFEGIDGFAPDGKTSVQVKATGTGRGPAFRNTKTRADHLIFLDLDMNNLLGSVIFNGPEHYATSKLPETFSGQRSLSANQIRQADSLVKPHERLALL